MKQWRKEAFKRWYNKQKDKNENKYIVYQDGVLSIKTNREIVEEIYHIFTIENDCSPVNSLEYYIEQFSGSAVEMVSLMNEYREGSGDFIGLTLLENPKISELLCSSSDLDYNKLKHLSDDEIDKILSKDEEEDIWIVKTLNTLLSQE